jgi:Integrase core domain
MGPLSPTANGNVYILHVIDYFSRFSHAWPTPVATEEVVIRCLAEFFDYYTKPVAVYADNGRHFGRKVEAWLERQKIDLPHTAVYSPKSAGMIEKRNHLLSERIRRMSFGNPAEWDQHVSAATRELNYHEIDAIGFSPFQILFGIERRVMLNCYRSENVAAVEKIQENVYELGQAEAVVWRAETQELVKDRYDTLAMERKYAYDRKLRGSPKSFLVGDLVMIHDKTEGKTKFDPRWRGPFRVVGKTHTLYRIQHLRHNTPYPGLFAPDDLRMYYPRPANLRMPGSQEIPLVEIPPETLRARRPRKVVV